VNRLSDLEAKRKQEEERGEETVREEGRRPNPHPIPPGPCPSEPIQPQADPSNQSLFTGYPPTSLPCHMYSYAYSFQAQVRSRGGGRWVGGGVGGRFVQCAEKSEQYYNL